MSVCQSVKLLVYVSCVVHIFLTQTRMGFVCDVNTGSRGNIMQVGLLGSKVIKGVLLHRRWNVFQRRARFWKSKMACQHRSKPAR